MTGEHVLIIDDNATNLKLARLALGDLGFDLTTAIDAESGLATMKERPADLVLVDIGLPGMDGLALTRLLRADPEQRYTGVIVVTASASDSVERNAYEAGCDAFVRKPIDTRALPRIAMRVLSARRRRKALCGSVSP